MKIMDFIAVDMDIYYSCYDISNSAINTRN
jgi:hypothetical protein